MFKLIKTCVPWLNWKVGLGILLGAVVLASFDKMLGLATVGAPILLMLACLVPCLIPLLFIRRTPVQKFPKVGSSKTCGCGNDSCTIHSAR